MPDYIKLYTCENCGGDCGTFESEDRAWSDADAEAEARALFGNLPESERTVLCDDCYRRFKAWLDSHEGRA